MPSVPSAPATPTPSMPRAVVLLMAAACGLSVANIYYAQPLLHTIGANLGVSDTTAGLLVTGAQVGYAVGLVALVPLGDLRERRGLVVTVLCVTALAAAACAVAPSFPLLLGAIVVLGLTSVVAQILVPMASTLAGEHERGQVVGTVMSGLLLGILAARTLSGLLAEVGGWRLVFVVAAVGMALLAVALHRRLPKVLPTETLRYPALLRSVLTLVREEPILRERMAIGFLGMTGFSALWTALTFLMSGAPYHASEGAIGLLGLAGVAGAVVAPIAGRLADGGRGTHATIGFLLVVIASWGLLVLGRDSLVALIAGIVVFDLGVQGTQINNQSAIYALRPEARSRLTTAFLLAAFVGATVGSLLASVLFSAGGWEEVCGLGVLCGVGQLAIAARGAWRRSRAAGRTA